MFNSHQNFAVRCLFAAILSVGVIGSEASAAGNVSVYVKRNDLIVTGDRFGNTVQIEPLKHGMIRVRGISGTTVNGREHVTYPLAPYLDDIDIDMGSGGGTCHVVGIACDSLISRGTVVLDGCNFRRVSINAKIAILVETDVTGELAITGTDGDDHIQIKNCHLGDTTIDTWGGDDDVYLFATYNEDLLFSKLQMALGDGYDTVRCDADQGSMIAALSNDSWTAAGYYWESNGGAAFNTSDAPHLSTIWLGELYGFGINGL